MEMVSLPDLNNSGEVNLKNGKVRRRLKWKPLSFRKKKNQVSSSMTVVSSLTNLSGKSVFSKKSQKSQSSFHTLHSTQTPVKCNRKGRKLHYTRPEYIDTFAKKQNTTEIEGHRIEEGKKQE